MSRVLVTGAKGFLGKSVVKTLNKNKDFEVISLGGRSEWDLTKQKHVDYILKEFQKFFLY